MTNQTRALKPISVFTLIMINIIAIDNLRSLTAGAEYGFALVFFYLLAAVLFFIPTALVSAELATGWPNTGGAYIWVREAFGLKCGFLAIWFQWIYNVVWYPSIFIFIAGVLSYLIDPQLVNSKTYMLCVTLTAFWGCTFINCFNVRISSLVSVIGAILGTLFPMIFICVLGFYWLYLGKPSEVSFKLQHFFPKLTDLHNLAFLTNILFGLMGIEMSAVHAGDVRHPKRDYPNALICSSIIILATFILSSLAITIVVPVKTLNLVSGLIDAFTVFLNAFHLGAWVPIIAILIIMGSLSGASAWILGPARGLLIASKDSHLPAIFTWRHANNMPLGILVLQGATVTLFCGLIFIMPSVSSSYWVFSNLTAQLALIFYIFLFAAAIRLRYKKPQVTRAYQIPGGKLGIWLVCGTGMITCLAAIIVGFLPPNQIAVGNIWGYEAILFFGIILCSLPPFIFIKKLKPKVPID